MLPIGYQIALMRALAGRPLIFLIGADLIPQVCPLRFRLAMTRERQPEFLTQLWTLSESLPIVAQLDWKLTDEETPPKSRSSRSGENSPRIPISSITQSLP